MSALLARFARSVRPNVIVLRATGKAVLTSDTPAPSLADFPDTAPVSMRAPADAASFAVGDRLGTASRSWSGQAAAAYLADVRETDIFLNIFPMFHAGGLFAFSVPLLMLGGTVVQTRRFEPAQVLDLIARERVTIFGGVPTVFAVLARLRLRTSGYIGRNRFRAGSSSRIRWGMPRVSLPKSRMSPRENSASQTGRVPLSSTHQTRPAGSRPRSSSQLSTASQSRCCQ